MAAEHFSVDERTSLTRSNNLELLLFRLGCAPGGGEHELYGINVFKIREIMSMPRVTPIAASSPYVLGAAEIRGQTIPVIDLPVLMGCNPVRGRNILLVAEFARSIQGFAVEEVDDIVRLDWGHVLSAENVAGGDRVTSIARIDGNRESPRLALVVDVEQVLRDVFPDLHRNVGPEDVGAPAVLPAGARILAADDSAFARKHIEQGLGAMGVEYIMAKTGLEAWNVLDRIAHEAETAGQRARERIALVLTDLEMPEMDGFMLTRRIRGDARTHDIPVVIHSSLTGAANEAHVRNAGATSYLSKFAPGELAETIRRALAS